jgi:hypothetical protein
MRMLPLEYKEFKLEAPLEGTKNYFYEYSAHLWSFRHYFNSTHGDGNKFKIYSKILNDFKQDINWLKANETTPEIIKKTS